MRRVIPFPEVFALDPRGLALFRIGLGVLVILKLASLAPEAALLLGPEGLLPASLIGEKATPFAGWLPYAWTGSTGQILALMAVHALVAGAFAAGWHMRVTAPLLWVLTLSLNSRNPLIMNSGDRLMVILLFCAMFLPLGRYLALDARQGRAGMLTPLARGCGVFGSTLLLLVAIGVYFISGLAKSSPMWSIEYQALLVALRSESYATALGTYLCQFPELLQGLTFATIHLEQFFILLLLSPFYNQPIRLVLSLLFIGLHVGIILTLDIGLFGYVCLLMWLPILPPMAYDWLGERMKKLPAAPQPLAGSWGPTVAAIAFMALLVAGSYPKGKADSTQRIANRIIRGLSLNQDWKMYAPFPATSTRWHAVEAVNDAGERLNLYPLREREFLPPADEITCASYPSAQLRKTLIRLAERKDPVLFQALCTALQKHWGVPGLATATDFEIVEWRRLNYPVPQKDFTRTVLYSSRRGNLTAPAIASGRQSD